ncbi:CBO0543 family protein [Pseudoneobacillus sp. C159]
MMISNLTMLYSVWGITLISVVYLPKKRLREASIIFLFQQFFTWFLGLITVELGLLEYPYRELASVNKTSFTFEFFVYPVISAFFVLFYPKSSRKVVGFVYSTIFTTGLVIPEVLIEKYTDLVTYVHWAWYVSWITIFLTLYMAKWSHRWFFKYDKAASTQKDNVILD